MTNVSQEYGFEAQLGRYAELAIRVGLNLQPGQRLLVSNAGEIESIVPFMRQLAEKAYRAGARYVDTIWTDEQLGLIRLQHAQTDSLGEVPNWHLDARMAYGARGDAVMVNLATDPDLFARQDGALVAMMQQARAEAMRPFNKLIGQGAVNWLIIAVPTPAWARKVFPDLPEEEQVPSLWQTVFEANRLDQRDPVAAWQAHLAGLVARRDALTNKGYEGLHFTGPGTDLTVGLVARHLWCGGRESSRAGIVFTPNLPTEEVFTMPDRARVDGVVRASKPLSYAGVLIEDFSLTFRQGRVVDVSARTGGEMLSRIMETDDGASRLGEVALVPHSSPISRAGRLFFNSLFDENAACHLALGDSLAFSLEGGVTLSNEERIASGGNVSAVHIDFMIGSGEMDVDGLTTDKMRESLMRAGEWVSDA